MTEPRPPNKSFRGRPRPLGQLVNKTIAEAFARQGFASTELITRWPDIAGREIAAHCEPIKLQWPRSHDPEAPEPATLVLRVEGPAAIEIQHLGNVICERVNRFLGWRAVGGIALRQAPLSKRTKRATYRPVDPKAAEKVAQALTDVVDDGLREALGRLGAVIKRT
jgi:hypothetical protein